MSYDNLQGTHRIRELPFAYDALDGISEQVNRWHHDKHYAGYVTKRNEIEKLLTEADRGAAHATDSRAGGAGTPSAWGEYGELKRSEAFNASGQILHEVYYGILGGDGQPRGEVVRRIEEDFGSFDAWKQDFTAAALAAQGWAVLAWDPSDGRLRNFVADAHDRGVWGAVPLVPVDVYEHAYYYDRGPDRAKYLEAFLKNLDWAKVNERFKKLVPAL